MSDIRLTDPATTFIASAHDLASDYAHPQITPLHLALVLLDPPPQSPSSAPPSSTASPPLHKITTLASGNLQTLDRALKKALVRLPSADPPPDSIAPSPAFGKVLRAARDTSALSVAEIDTWHLVHAVAKDVSVSRALQEAGVSESAVDEAVKSIRVKQKGRDKDNPGKGKGKASSGGSGDGNTSSLLTKYTTNLVELARRGEFDPFIGRELEIRRIMTILKRRKDSSVLLVGEHGVGKTALISHLATRISDGTAPTSLLSAKLLSLNIPLLTSATDVEIRQNMLGICQAVASSPNSILVINDIGLLLAVCAYTVSIICPLLHSSSDPLRVIATATPSIHKTVLAPSPLSSLLHPLPIARLPAKTITSMLIELKSKFEIYYGVDISYKAIVACANQPPSLNQDSDDDNHVEPVLPADAIHRLDAAASALALTRELGPLDYEILTDRQRTLDVVIAEMSRSHPDDDPDADAVEMIKLGYTSERSSIASRLESLQEARDKASEVTRLKGEIGTLKMKMEQLQIKKQAAEHSNDLMTASDIAYYAIPELSQQIASIEKAVKFNEKEGENASMVGEKEVKEVLEWMGGGGGEGDTSKEALGERAVDGDDDDDYDNELYE